MNKRSVLAAIGGAATLFLLGGLIFGLLLKSYMEKIMQSMGDCGNPNPSMLNIFGANLVLAILLTLILNQREVKTFGAGIKNAAWIGTLIMLWFDQWMFASFQFMTMNLFLFDFVSNTILITLGGGVIGWILGKVK
jgi:hypothetical protein